MNKKRSLLNIKSLALSVLVLSISNAYAEDAKVAESSKPVVEQIVNTLTKLSGGPYQGYRANHAKGKHVEKSIRKKFS